jgi:acyl-CoA reductase-like NAD-dependent aldehyde dehydrogenase
LLAREEGKILAEGIGEVVRAGQIFAFFAGEALRIAGEKLASPLCGPISMSRSRASRSASSA